MGERKTIGKNINEKRNVDDFILIYVEFESWFSHTDVSQVEKASAHCHSSCPLKFMMQARASLEPIGCHSSLHVETLQYWFLCVCVPSTHSQSCPITLPPSHLPQAFLISEAHRVGKEKGT